MSKKDLPNTLEPQQNLFEVLPEQFCVNVTKRLERIFGKLLRASGKEKGSEGQVKEILRKLYLMPQEVGENPLENEGKTDEHDA